MRFLQTVLSSIATFALCGAVQAAIIPGSLSETIVESRTGGLNFAAYSEGQPAAGTNNWQNSTGKSTAAGVTAASTVCVNTAGIQMRSNSTVSAGGLRVRLADFICGVRRSAWRV